MSAPPIPAVIHEGERNAQLTSFAGTLRRYGCDEATIAKTLLTMIAERCQPPLPERDVRRIAKSVVRYAPSITMDQIQNDGALYRLNETYAVVQVGGDVVILQRSADDQRFELMTAGAFRLLLKNQFVTRPKEDGQTVRRPLADEWLEWPERRLYGQIVFKPGQSDVGDDYNLWRGWAVEPSRDGSCELFLRHLRVAVCHGNRDHFEWLLDWFADLVQNPMRKPGSAVALRGPQGTGKSIVGATLKPILGVHQLVVEKAGQVIGRFNGHLAHCLLLQAEEAFWGGNREARGVLKHLVTGTTLPIERKGVDTVTMPNYTRLLITSNEPWVWPAEIGDRRIVIFEVEKHRQRDRDYFDALTGELEAGGYAHLLYVLQRRRIDEQRLLRRLPTTMALEDQIALTASPEEAWFRVLLVEGRLLAGMVDADGYAHLPVKALHEDYLNYVKHVGGRYPMNEEQLGIFLRKHLPRPKSVPFRGKTRFYLNGQRVQSRGRVIRPLAECRRRYEKQGRGAPQKWNARREWRIAD